MSDPYPGWQSTGLILGTSLFLLAMLIQLIVLKWLKPQKTTGDETEYINKAKHIDAECLWLRVPLFVLIPWLALRWDERHQTRNARFLVSVISASTTGVAGWWVHQQAGLCAGLIAGLLILLSLERAILAIHLWPDIMLGLWFLLFTIAMTQADGQYGWGLLGIIAALGFLTRLDFAVLGVFGWVLALVRDADPLISFVLVIGPTLFAALLLAVRNGLVHGLWLPDTTFLFNFNVAATETKHPGATTGELMLRTAEKLRMGRANADSPWTGIRQVFFNQPVLCLVQMFRRIVILLGRETFVRQNLVQHNRAAYVPALHLGTIAGLNLLHWFSIVFVGFLFFIPDIRSDVVSLVLVMVFVQSSVQTRSRYRMSIYPALSASVVIGAWGAAGSGEVIGWVSANGLLAVAAAFILIIARPRPELETP